MQAIATTADPQRRARRALEALNFFMADMQAGALVDATSLTSPAR